MKLRIQGNLLRLRLTQKEVVRLAERGLVGCVIQFGSGRTLSYLLPVRPMPPKLRRIMKATLSAS